ERRLARGYRNRLMNDVDPVLADQPPRNATLRDLGGDSRQELGRQVAHLRGKAASDAPQEPVPGAVLDVDNVRVAGKRFVQLATGARMREQPGRAAAPPQLAVVVKRKRRFAAELGRGVLGDD